MTWSEVQEVYNRERRRIQPRLRYTLEDRVDRGLEVKSGCYSGKVEGLRQVERLGMTVHADLERK